MHTERCIQVNINEIFLLRLHCESASRRFSLSEFHPRTFIEIVATATSQQQSKSGTETHTRSFAPHEFIHFIIVFRFVFGVLLQLINFKRNGEMVIHSNLFEDAQTHPFLRSQTAQADTYRNTCARAVCVYYIHSSLFFCSRSLKSVNFILA